MNQKSLRTLEYYKIISQLTEYASSQLGKELCRNLVPSTSLAEISQTLQETTDAVTRVRQKGSLSFGGIRDIRDSLKRLDVGSSLGIVELLAVSALLTAGYLSPPVMRGFLPGREHGEEAPCEAKLLMTAPMVILALLAVGIGVYPEPLMQVIRTAAAAVLGGGGGV